MYHSNSASPGHIHVKIIREILDDDDKYFMQASSEHLAPAWDVLHDDDSVCDGAFFAKADRNSMQQAGGGGKQETEPEGELEEVIALLRSRNKENQMKGIDKLEACNYTAATVEILTQHGHLEALCALTAVFLCQQQQQHATAIGENIEMLPGFRALHIMFRIGAVAQGFRAVAAAIIALAMPLPDSAPAHGAQCTLDDTQRGRLEGKDAEKGGTEFPALSHVLAEKNDVLHDHQHLTWNAQSLSLRGLPHGNRHAVKTCAAGANLWVYTTARTKIRKQAFQAFVQMLPTGSLYIGGKEQQVSVMSVVQGSTPELDAAFNISGKRRGCVFRLQAMPRDCALASAEPVSLAFGASTIDERNCWMQGIAVVLVRSSASHSSHAPSPPSASVSRATPPVHSATTGSGKGAGPLYRGSCDIFGVPDGQGIAMSADGSRHIGNWCGGMLSGWGAMLLPSGDKYMGEWNQGIYDDIGTHTYAHKYVSEWHQGMFQYVCTPTHTRTHKHTRTHTRTDAHLHTCIHTERERSV